MTTYNFSRISLPNDSIVYNIGRLYVLLDSYLYKEAYKEFNLNPAKFNLLMVVKHIGKDNGLSQREISNSLYVSAANITKLIDTAEREGLVARGASGQDRRINLIKITEKGSKLLDEVWPKHVSAINNIFEKISMKDRQKLNRLLDLFKKNMEAR